MDKRKEGKPGEARAALRRSVRDNGSVFATLIRIVFFFFPHKSIKSNMIVANQYIVLFI